MNEIQQALVDHLQQVTFKNRRHIKQASHDRTNIEAKLLVQAQTWKPHHTTTTKDTRILEGYIGSLYTAVTLKEDKIVDIYVEID